MCACGRSYIRRQHLARHETKCDGKKDETEINEQDANSSVILKDKESNEFFCPTCQAGPFSKKKSVWAHLAVVHGFVTALVYFIVSMSDDN